MAVLAITGLPAWIPLFRGEPLSPSLKRSLYLIATSQALQATFVLGVGLGWASFEYSLGLAAVSVPLCVFGAGLAVRSVARDRIGTGNLVAAVFSVLLWFLLITFH